MENSYKYFKNDRCKYFPCHTAPDVRDFNCLFCFCPLYGLGDKCCGEPQNTDQNIKVCTNCIFPHLPESYDIIVGKLM